MQKRKQGRREIRHHGSKRKGKEWNDHPKHTPSGHFHTASEGFEQYKHITTDAHKLSEASTRWSRQLQDENVQRWLDQTTQETDIRGRENVFQRVDSGGLSGELNSAKSPRVREHVSKTEHEKAQGRPSKRKLGLSSDSSLLERALTFDPDPEVLRNNGVEGIEKGEKLETSHKFPRGEKSVDFEENVVPLSRKTQDDSFAKRKRHKTKLDRYEPKRALANPKSQKDKKDKKAKGEGSQSRRRLQKNTASHLMHQFSSEKIGLDRLTMRPSLTAGLFKNGRASSPMRRRGLPDLAFSEMEFLRRPKQCSVEVGYNTSFPKSRNKARWKSERALDEISQYFKPFTESCGEVEANQVQKSKRISKHNCRSPQEGAEENSNQPSSSKPIEQSVGSSIKSSLDQDHRRVSERLPFEPNLRRKPVESGVTSDMTMVLSNGEGSFYTWSNSGNLPSLLLRNKEAYSVASTTPERVRIMMNDTGIFKGTGIDRSTTQMRDRVRTRHSTSSLLNNTSKLSNTRISDTPTEHARKTSRAKTQNSARIEKWDSVPRNQQSPCALKPEPLSGNSNTIRNEDIPRTTESITHNSSQNSGAKEYSGGKDSVSYPHQSKAKHSQRSLSRHEIAQKAYITHSTTISTAIPANESLKRPLISGETPEQKTSRLHMEAVKLIAPGEINADASSLLDVGPEKPQGVRCNNMALNHQALEALPPSVASANEQDQIMQLTDELQSPCRTPEVINHIPNTYPTSESRINHVEFSNIGQQTRASLHLPVYEGLPIRGSWPDQIRRPISSHLNVNLLGRAGSLYGCQVRNDMPHGFGDRSYGHGISQRQPLHSYGTPLNIRNNGSNNLDTLDGGYKLFSGTANMQENHTVVSNDVECVAQESLQEEEEPSLWAYHDILPLTGRRDHDFHESSHTANSSNQPYLPVPENNFKWERNHLCSSHELAQHLTHAGNLGDEYELRRFWQPRRQY